MQTREGNYNFLFVRSEQAVELTWEEIMVRKARDKIDRQTCLRTRYICAWPRRWSPPLALEPVVGKNPLSQETGQAWQLGRHFAFLRFHLISILLTNPNRKDEQLSEPHSYCPKYESGTCRLLAKRANHHGGARLQERVRIELRWTPLTSKPCWTAASSLVWRTIQGLAAQAVLPQVKSLR